MLVFLFQTDVNECQRGYHSCHPNSQCVNLPGSYECHCPMMGYRGRYCDGKLLRRAGGGTEGKGGWLPLIKGWVLGFVGALYSDVNV